MRDYSKVSPQFWTGKTGRIIRDLGRGHQLLALYLMSCPSSNMIGLYYLPIPIISHETGMSLKESSETLAGLVGEGFATYDEESEYVFVVEMARFQIGEELSMKDNRRISVVRELKSTKTYLVDLFIDRYGKAFNISEEIYPAVTNDRFSKSVYLQLSVRDGDKCKYCNSNENLTIDHVLAKINGGRKNVENLQLLCSSCNSKKSAKDREYFWKNRGTTLEGVSKGSRRGQAPPSKPGAGAGAEKGTEAGADTDAPSEKDVAAAAYQGDLLVVTSEMHAALLGVYDEGLCMEEYPKANLWLKNNPKKRKKNFGSFLANWMEKAAGRTTGSSSRTVPPSLPFQGKQVVVKCEFCGIGGGLHSADCKLAATVNPKEQPGEMADAGSVARTILESLRIADDSEEKNAVDIAEQT